ncbi:hypothetical protein EBBID32_9990 [Sphingobium indicum BiD32]|uniref:Transposase n=1 Tax=Sphingobium indicum BiD32 TaxID=1301087 RepID=N1MIA3_9SPHN|nr:hypothetical protein EBBID32_9990 [Sphingobium indicum BiD32]
MLPATARFRSRTKLFTDIPEYFLSVRGFARLLFVVLKG